MKLEATLRGASRWRGAVDAEAKPRPPAKLMPARLRRRASLLTKLAVEVATRAALAGEEEGRLDAVDAEALSDASIELARSRLHDHHFVLVSAWGEIETTDGLLDAIDEGPGGLSPTAFHNSVHNTATGYLSLATQNRFGSTAISGGLDAAAAGLLDALMRVSVDTVPVMLIFADEAIPRSFVPETAVATSPVAAALWLEPTGKGKGPVLRLTSSDEPTSLPGGLDITAKAIATIWGVLAGNGPAVLASAWGACRLELEARD